MFVSLVLLIHESVNPQIVLLWRLPGTEIYRNVEQESIGEFVPGVLCVRIGAAMYFANAALVKDRLLQYVRRVMHSFNLKLRRLAKTTTE